MSEQRMFPIQGGPAVPWDYMAPHESQCQKNHSQSLARIAERGGLSPEEAECVVNGVRLYDIPREGWPHEKRAWIARAERVNRDWGNDKDQPLKCDIEGSQLVIRIGIDTLAFSAERCPLFYEYEKHRNSETYEKVVNNEELARDVIGMLTKEEEDGSSPLSDLFDRAIVDAREDGSIAFAEEAE